MSNIIRFVSNRTWIKKDNPSTPGPIIKTIPEWYRKADRFARKPNGDFWIGADKGKVPTWKACPAIFDIMSTGYTLKTPCDIEFKQEGRNQLSVTIADKKYKDFCTLRQPLDQFENPHGYYKTHFAWFPDWGVETPQGYSVLYSQPFNRYELPFMTTSGIIDNDNINLPGSMPFFLQEGFTGIIPAGTPFVQLVPFKREDWQSQVVIEEPHKIDDKNMKNSRKYRVPDGGVYKNKVWQPRKYE